jgi:hypothetical protein
VCRPETVGKALNPSKEALQSILGDLKVRRPHFNHTVA